MPIERNGVIDIQIDRAQNTLIRNLLDAHVKAYKNWIVSAIESEDYDCASQLVVDMKEYTKLFHTFVPDDMIKQG